MPKTRKPRKKRDPERTRSNLLHAGVKLFSAHGYHGVAVDQIVGEAGCNKRMLYHYFGNKDGLYVEVLREVFGMLQEKEILALDHELSIESAIRNILEGYFKFLEEHPEFVSLILWENLNGGRFLDLHPGLLSKSPVVRRLAKVLEAAQKRGEICHKVHASRLLVLLYGACFFHFSNRHTLRHTVGLDTGSPAAQRAGLRFAQDLIIKGLLNDTAAR